VHIGIDYGHKNHLGRWGWTEDGLARLEGSPTGLIDFGNRCWSLRVGKPGSSAFKRRTRIGLQTHHRPAIESIRLDQAVFSVHVRSALTNAFAVSMSLRMTATMATLAGFPAARRPSYFALRSGLNRMATSAGM